CRSKYRCAVEPLRLAVLLAGLSMVADIGMGLSPGATGRAAMLAMELADLTAADDTSDVYNTSLVQHAGRTGSAHESAGLRTGGEAIALPARIAQVAVTASLFHTLGGREAALEAVRRRAGGALDPGLVELVCLQSGRILTVLETGDPLSAAVKAEPGPLMRI